MVETCLCRSEQLTHPVLFRAFVQSLVGEGCPFPTIKALADHHGLHPEHLRMFMRGLRPAEPKLLKAFGMERAVFYRPLPKAPDHGETNG